MSDGRTSSQPQTTAELLATQVQFLKGVGPQRAEGLQRLGLHTARDLLFYFPRDYQDLAELNSIDDLEEDRLVRLRGTVLDIESRMTRVGRSVIGVLVRVGAGNVRALWFNQPYMRERFTPQQQVLLEGKAKFKGGIWQLVHPITHAIETEDDEPAATLLPVYGLTEGVRQPLVRRAVRSALELCLDALEEVFPSDYLTAHDLWPLRTALPELHFPSDREHLDRARRRFIYQELFVLQLALALKHTRQHEQARAMPLEATGKIDARIRRLFPFELTAGQNRAIDEIRVDMARPHPMNRLLQGDVGSGKTMVAMYAVLLAVAHGQQAAIMAPTEILARQHGDTLGKLLSSSKVRWALLTGGVAPRERQEILSKLAGGELDVVIGTQALVDPSVEFARLALVVIDEQHKFGVRQRGMLRHAGVDPHYLVMTATPIPRSVAMTLFGDLDVTTITDAPPGRQQMHTYLASPDQREAWWEFFRKKLRSGCQGYVIAPRVEESDEAHEDEGRPPPANVEQQFEMLAHGPLEAFRLGLLHGRMTPREKQAAMEAFRSGKTQVLVATTVVEVGVDVPNATLLTIEDAQSFGLSQLHQLRGRISRGTRPGYCCAFTSQLSDEAQKRLDAFVGTNDGFELAEIDFRLRGPGDLFGTEQHGLPPFRIADLLRDAEVLIEARRDAQQAVKADPDLQRPEFSALRRMMLVRYGDALDLGDVG
ncbi:MAG TPA: ATP-dependent DNA helicase RecG [Pirellulales bacterium]|nr:ATP-dependent DNA helicase RecG [Pirellulales bacterium]